MIHEDTICAISSAPGVGGVALIRVSGTRAIEICDNVFTPIKKGKTLASMAAYTCSYGSILDAEGATIDDVMMTVFRAPQSYTGEETIEIGCHGSIYVQQRVMERLIEAGCRTATAGEFTRRAFASGKMDLVQAEAVADLIASTSAAQHRLAVQQMRGGFSRELTTLRSMLIELASLIELELDFSEEDVEFADRAQLQQIAQQMMSTISRLINSFQLGNAIKNGIPVAIVGETNAGKSTLLNALLGEERAIVSDIPGTTRDTIEDTINIEGVTFRFIDTAGIRETADRIESIGIERAFAKIKQAQIVLWIVDATKAAEQIAALADRIIPISEDKSLLVLFNKCDLLTEIQKTELLTTLPSATLPHLLLSADDSEQIIPLRAELAALAAIPALSSQEVVLTNIRHMEALTHAQSALQRVLDGLATGLSGDFVSQDLRDCLFHIGEITGSISTDDLLGNIFDNFCIGK